MYFKFPNIHSRQSKSLINKVNEDSPPFPQRSQIKSIHSFIHRNTIHNSLHTFHALSLFFTSLPKKGKERKNKARKMSRSSSAVDDIISEAMDAIALDHIAKLNTAHISSSSPSLPSDLESRFRKLKSFPSSSSSSSNPAPNPLPHTITASRSLPTGKENTAPALVPEQVPPVLPAVSVEVVDSEKTDVKKEMPSIERKSLSKPSLPDLHSSDESRGISLSPSKKRDPTSPTFQQGCCFPFSPKKTLITSIISPKTKVKNKNTKDLDLNNVNEWGDMNKKMAEEIKDQQRKLKKALKEQERVSKEAAKMVRMVKHSSARMTHDINEDLFSDFENDDDDDHFKI